MILGLYTVYDIIAQEAGPVYEAVNNGVALRNYNSMLEKLDESVRGEYKLYMIGSRDTNTMKIIPIDPQEITVGTVFEAKSREVVNG